MTTLITGANRGIGTALRDRLLARGDDVIGTTRADPAPDGFVTLDVTDPDAHRRMAGALAGRPVGLLVCNAGIFPKHDESLDTGYPAEVWGQVFAANVTGVFLTIQALLPNLRAAPGAKIAIISSQMGSSERAHGDGLIYRASKSAATNLGRNLAVALRPEGIAVGIYHPGWVRTDMGGSTADISVAESSSGLIDRFDALSLATTGVFETWDGRAHPF